MPPPAATLAIFPMIIYVIDIAIDIADVSRH